jgi:hypothetical protein
LPGPIPTQFGILAEGLENNVGSQAAGFVRQVFSLFEVDQVKSLIGDADMSDVSVARHQKELRLPPPEDFLWQFVQSTPLAQFVAEAKDESLAALQESVISKWQSFVKDGALEVSVPMVTATARRK